MGFQNQNQCPSSLDEVISRGASSYPQKVALLYNHRKLTYRDLRESVSAHARQLCELGLANARGGVFIGNSPEYVIAYFSIAAAGGTIVPFKSSLPLGRLVSEIDFCDLDYLITTSKHAELLRRRTPSLKRLSWLLVLELPPLADCPRLRAISLAPAIAEKQPRSHPRNDLAIMLSTSGTLSRPKWVMLSHANVLENMASFLEMAELQDSDVGLIALPLMASGTNTTELLAYLWRGMTVALYPHATFLLNDYCRLVKDLHVSVANLTPFVLELMLRDCDKVAEKLSSLKKVFFASAPISRRSLLRLQRKFPQIAFYYGYGLTEAGPRCSTLRPSFLPTKLGSVGTPLKGVQIKVVAPDRSTLRPGHSGEIAVRSKHVMLGYYKQPGATASVLRDGWLHTGDLGYLDSDDFLYVKGRTKNVIISRGLTICPEEVEEALLMHPKLRDAYVVGQKDGLTCERIIAYVVPHIGTIPTERELKAFLLHALERMKVPHSIFFTSELHRNEHHKLRRTPNARGFIPLRDRMQPRHGQP